MFEPPLKAPFAFKRYKNVSRTAAFIEDASKKIYDVAVAHLVPFVVP